MRSLLLRLTAIAVLCFFIVSNIAETVFLDRVTRQLAERTLADAAQLLMKMRAVYRQRIMAAHMELTPETVRLCPGSVIGEMSDGFASAGLSFGNVSDQPRNPKNKADRFAKEAIRYFRQNPNEKFRFEDITSAEGKPAYQYAVPLWVETPCLTCHGAKATTPAVIQQRYETGFDYEIGDLRGVLYTRIDAEDVKQAIPIYARFVGGLVSALVLFLLLVSFFDRFFLRRLRELKKAAVEVGKGKFTAVPTTGVDDEIELVANQFNEMVAAVETREAKMAEQAKTISQQERFLQTVMDAMPEPVTVIDGAYRVMQMNRAARKLAGVGEEENAPRHCYELFHQRQTPCMDGDRPCPIRCVLETGENARLTQNFTHDGQNSVYDLQITPLHDASGRVIGVVESCHDVTEREYFEAVLKASREEMAQIAHLDALTGLGNRLSFEESLAAALAEAERTGVPLGLMFLDLDGFKDINDSLGHPVGDALLKIVAERLQGCIRRSDFVGRLAGDEFVVIVRQAADPEVLHRISHEILSRQQQPFALAGGSVYVTTSIGVAIYPHDGRSPEDLVKAADIAMYAAKNSGKNRISFFRAEMDTAVSERFSMLAELRSAIENNEFYLEYQPQFTNDGLRIKEDGVRRMRGVEALMRWMSPRRGRVRPDTFIPLLEESGLIHQVSHWLLHTALVQLRRWIDAGHPPIVMSINVSATEFAKETFVSRIEEALLAHGIAPDWLEVEITERMALDNMERMLDVLARLRKIGVRCAMDDFGTGFSSLSYLTRLPIDTLKIDRSFVCTLAEDKRARSVIQLIAGLGHSLGMEIIAEGIETATELDYVQSAGCAIVQGYLLGKPVSAAAVSELWNELETRREELLQHLLIQDDTE